MGTRMALFSPYVHDGPTAHLNNSFHLFHRRRIDPVLGIAEQDAVLLNRLPDPGAALHRTTEHHILRYPESNVFPLDLPPEVPGQGLLTDDVLSRPCRGEVDFLLSVV